MLMQLVQRLFAARTEPDGPLSYDSRRKAHRSARGAGYLAGRFGDPCVVPADVDPNEEHIFIEGWQDGKAMRDQFQRLDAEMGLK